MRTLELKELELVSGGSWIDFADGFCMGMTAGAGLVKLGIIAATGTGVSIAGGIILACGTYGAVRWVTS